VSCGRLFRPIGQRYIILTLLNLVMVGVRIHYSSGGNERIFDEPRDEIIVGRQHEGAKVDIDLSPDLRVSRRHARISYDGGYWLEDLGSSNGTVLDGQLVQPETRIALCSGQSIGIGDTLLMVEIPTGLNELISALSGNETINYSPGRLEPELDIGEVIDATAPPFDADHPIDPARAQHMALLYELPLRFGEQTDLDSLLQVTIEALVQIIPAASRGALLIKELATDELLLKAHVPSGRPSVSMTLAQRAMGRRQGLIWRRVADPSRSQIVNRIEAGMYVPLVYKGEVVGVVCVDNSDQGTTFAAEDLRIMLAAAHHASLAVTQARLQQELTRNSVLLSRLLTNFSPAIRDRLLIRARHGRLRLGGERSEVVVLQSDIRAFTRLTANMDADEIVDLLNDYFSAQVEAIFRHDGTIDKYFGDAILAVFGSPEPDLLRHEKAIRASFAIQAAMVEVSARRRARGQVTCEIGIGLHAGEVLHGFIGSNDRMELTIIGETVNWGARYCDGAGPGQILISPAMHEHTWRLIESEPITIQTKHEGPLRAYKILCLKREPP
jgi:adenylate cyclase